MPRWSGNLPGAIVVHLGQTISPCSSAAGAKPSELFPVRKHQNVNPRFAQFHCPAGSGVTDFVARGFHRKEEESVHADLALMASANFVPTTLPSGTPLLGVTLLLDSPEPGRYLEPFLRMATPCVGTVGRTNRDRRPTGLLPSTSPSA
jgi:hypothetical protein